MSPTKLVIYANCQAVALAALLKLIPDFENKFTFFRIKPVHRITQEELQKVAEDVFPSTGLFIHQPIQNSFRGGGFGSEQLKDLLPSNCQIISFPSLQFYGYQPAAFSFKDLPLEHRVRHSEIFNSTSTDTFHYTQVVRAYLSGATISEAYKTFHGGLENDDVMAREVAFASIQKIAQSETNNGIDLTASAYIRNNFTENHLFNTPRHPSNLVLFHVIKQLCDLLGVKISQYDTERIHARNPLRYPCYPLQSYVREAFNLRYEHDDLFVTKHRKSTMSGIEMVSTFYRFYSDLDASYLATAVNQHKQAMMSLSAVAPAMPLSA